MAFDLELECAKARERVHRSIGQRWRHAKAETKRLADAARAEIERPRTQATWHIHSGGTAGPGYAFMALHDVQTPADSPTDGGY